MPTTVLKLQLRLGCIAVCSESKHSVKVWRDPKTQEVIQAHKTQEANWRTACPTLFQEGNSNLTSEACKNYKVNS